MPLEDEDKDGRHAVNKMMKREDEGRRQRQKKKSEDGRQRRSRKMQT